ncbi:MAG: hypothetical protein GXX85_14730 [Ignavibacteria bacterium]|nr:hypothetical protein [Ignavibacteria bacterium]
MLKKKLVFIILKLFLIIGNDINYAQNEFNIVAEYDDTNFVKFEELAKYVSDWQFNLKYRDKFVSFKYAVNEMIINKIKRLDYFDKKMDTCSNVIKNLGLTVNDELTVKYYERKFLNKYTNEEFTKKIYNVMDRVVYFQEIEIEKQNDKNSEKVKRIEDIIEKIRIDVDNGKSIKESIKKYKNEIKVVKIQEAETNIIWKHSIIDPVNNKIFNSNEGKAIAFSTPVSYRIVKITRIEKIKIDSYENVKDEIIEECIKNYDELCFEDYKKYKISLIDTTSLKWNDDEIMKLTNYAKNPLFFINAYEETLSKEILNGNKRILTHRAGYVDYKYLKYLVSNVYTIKNPMELNEEQIKQFIIDAITTEIITQEAINMGLQTELFANYEDNMPLRYKILQIYNKVEIENKIPEINDKRRLEFYKENMDSIFYQLNKVNFLVMVFDNANEAKQIFERINSGTTFEKALNRYLVRTYIKSKNGEIKSVLKNDKPIFSDYVFGMKENEISDVIKFTDQDNKDKFAIIKCVTYIPEKQLTFEESKKDLDEEYKKYYYNKIDKEIIEKLVEKYKPVYHYDVIEKCLSGNK